MPNFLNQDPYITYSEIKRKCRKMPSHDVKENKKKILNLLYLDLHQKLTGYILGQDESC